MELSSTEKKDIEENIKAAKKEVDYYKSILDCTHIFAYNYGDDISTTGPTGIFKWCKNCSYRKIVGHSGATGNKWYNNDGDDAPRTISM